MTNYVVTIPYSTYWVWQHPITIIISFTIAFLIIIFSFFYNKWHVSQDFLMRAKTGDGNYSCHRYLYRKDGSMKERYKDDIFLRHLFWSAHYDENTKKWYPEFHDNYTKHLDRK